MKKIPHTWHKMCTNIEAVEGYDAFMADETNTTYVMHHKNGEHIETDMLKAFNLYYNRPPEELIIITESEHNRIHGANKKLYKAKPVVCMESKLIYNSVGDAARWLNLTPSNISRVCLGKCNHYKKMHFEFYDKNIHTYNNEYQLFNPSVTLF